MISRIDVGGPGAEVIQQALLKHYNKKNNNGDDNNNDNMIEITNKYFTARIEIRILNLIDDTKNNQSEEYTQDGIILCHNHNDDSSSSSSLDQVLSPIHSIYEMQSENDLIRLVVDFCKSDDTTTNLDLSEEDYSHNVLWCLDRGYEYIPMPNLQLYPQTVLKGHEERDKQGFARLVEALEGTIWTSAVRHVNKNKKTKNVTTTNDNETRANQQHKTESKTTSNEDSSKQEDPSKTTSNDDSSKQEDPSKTTTIHTNDDVSGKKHENYFQQEVDNEKHDDEDDVDVSSREFEGMLNQARRIRELSCRPDMTEDQRRERAADAADLIMSLMMQSPLGDDEDDDDDDSQS